MPPAADGGGATTTMAGPGGGGGGGGVGGNDLDDPRAPLHRRLHTLRSKLLLLEYKEELGVESLKLVEHLFGDLVTTSESYERLQQREDRLSHDLALAQAQLLPLRKTIARLTRENNQLHARVIKVADDDDEKELTYKKDMGILQGELQAMQHLLKAKEQQLTQKRRRNLILERELRRYMQEESEMGGADTTAPLPSSRSVSEEGEEFSSLGEEEEEEEEEGEEGEEGEEELDEEERIGLLYELRQRVTELETENEVLAEERLRSRRAMQAREDEMARLAALVEEERGGTTPAAGGDSSAAAAASAARQANARIVDQLNSQVDFLNSQLAAKEAQLHALGGGDEIRMSHEARRVLQAQIQQLTKDKARHLQQLSFMQDKLKETEKELEEVKHAYHLAIGGPQGLSEKEKLRNELRRLKEKDDKAKSELTHKQDRIQTLEGDLHLILKEKEELRLRAEGLATKLSAARAEVGKLKQRLFYVGVGEGGGGGATGTHTHTHTHTGGGSEREALQRERESEDEIRKLKSHIISLEHALRDSREHNNGGSGVGVGVGVSVSGGGSGDVNMAMQEERRRLLSLLADANRRVVVLEEEVRGLGGGGGSKREKKERREGEKQEQDQQQQEDTTTALEQTQHQLLLLQTTHASLQQQLDASLRDALREKDLHHEALARLEVARTQLLEKEEQVTQLKALFTQIHTGRDQINVRLQQSYEEIAVAEEREREAIERGKRLERRLEEKQAEVERLQRVLGQLDEERDVLQANLDEQEEVGVMRERERARYERSLRRMEGDLEEETRQKEGMREVLVGREKELRVVQEQVAGLQFEAGEAKKLLHSRLLEVRALTDDLQIMARETQLANTELQRVARERDTLKRENRHLQTRTDELESHLRGLQAERNDLIASYKVAQEQKQRLETEYQEMSRSRMESQMALGQTRAALAELREHTHTHTQQQQQQQAQQPAEGTATTTTRRFSDQDFTPAHTHTQAHLASTSARASAAEQERDTLTRVLQEEQTRMRKLEQLLADKRDNEMVQARQITTLMQEKFHLQQVLQGTPTHTHPRTPGVNMNVGMSVAASALQRMEAAVGGAARGGGGGGGQAHTHTQPYTNTSSFTLQDSELGSEGRGGEEGEEEEEEEVEGSTYPYFLSAGGGGARRRQAASGGGGGGRRGMSEFFSYQYQGQQQQQQEEEEEEEEREEEEEALHDTESTLEEYISPEHGLELDDEELSSASSHEI